MFADDTVLIATSFDRLSTLFGHMCDFCDQQALQINANKTELMVCGPAARSFTGVPTVSIRSSTFRVVTSFKYLGLHFDQKASAPFMIA
jgi:hypothetical protein